MNLELAEREYSKKGEHMCCKDGYVAFLNGELICGRLGKVGLQWESEGTPAWAWDRARRQQGGRGFKLWSQV